MMVIGIATGLLGLGLALPTGLAFGYGYGYGVRQGYSAFKQPSQGIQNLKMSPDPIQGSLGMGLQTAEERTNKQIQPPLSTGQPLAQTATALMSTPSTENTQLAPTIQEKLQQFKKSNSDRDAYYAEKRRLEEIERKKYSKYSKQKFNYPRYKRK